MSKTLLKSVFKNCSLKSGKENEINKKWKNDDFLQSFSTNLHKVLNRKFFSVLKLVFHGFHIPYYYNY